MIEISQRIFFIFIFLISSIAYSQTLFIPLSDPYIISIYKTGEKSQDGTYTSKDSLGNIRIKGKFNGIKPIGKWYVFFESGELNSNYAYNDDGNLDGLFVEYYNNGQIKSAGYFENNVQTSTWKTFYYDGIIETEGELLEGKRYKQWNYYFPSGKIKEISNYNFKGELSGMLISYDEFGKKVSEADYINNKLNGRYLEFYYNGRIALEGYYNLGLKDSIWEEYNIWGSLSFRKRYKDDLENSKWEYYYENGNIQKTESYVLGIKNGLFKEFYPNKKLSKQYYYKNDFLDSVYYEYLPNGSLSVEGEFNFGLKSGLWTTFREDENLYSIGHYLNDLQHGEWKYFHKFGNVLSEGIYEGGFKNGQWIFYDESGKLDEIGKYKNGLKEGLWGRFHTNGKLKQEEEYKNGKLFYVSDYYSVEEKILFKGSFVNGNGEIIDYFENGSVFSKTNYKNGFLNGKWLMFYPNGRVAEKGNYILNEKKGIWIKYNKRGMKISNEKYD